MTGKTGSTGRIMIKREYGFLSFAGSFQRCYAFKEEYHRKGGGTARKKFLVKKKE